jgi:hypothetical protein
MPDPINFIGAIFGIIEQLIIWTLEYIPLSYKGYLSISEALTSGWGHPECTDGLALLITMVAGICIWGVIGKMAKGFWKIAAIGGILTIISILLFLAGFQP